MDHTWKYLERGILIHTLVSHIMFVRGSHAFAIFYYMRGGATRGHERDELYQIYLKLQYGKPVCIV